MLKKEITYDDFDGNTLTEEFYFNLSTAEITELGGEDGELVKLLRTIVGTNDPAKTTEGFKAIISATIGRRSEDMKRFIKSPEIVDDFLQSNAFSELLYELFTNPVFAADFIIAVVPKQVQNNAAAMADLTKVRDIAAQGGDPAEMLKLLEAATPPAQLQAKKLAEYNQAELAAMPSDMYQQLIAQQQAQ